MKRSQIIDQADRKTERRAGNNEILHLGREYAAAVAEVCGEHHFHWRKKTATFVTTGASSYDLSSSTFGSMTDLDEISAMFYVKSDGSVTELVPLSDSVAQAEALAATYTETEPGAYMPILGTSKSVQLFPATTGHTIRVMYWAIPVIDEDDSAETVPLIPSQYHPMIVKCMEKNMLEFFFGLDDSRTIAAQKSYERLLERAIHTGHDFATTIPKRYARPQVPAIRSTH